MIKYCFISDTSLSHFQDEYELESGSVLTEKVILGLAYPQYSTCRAQGQSSSAHFVFSKSDIEHAVRLVCNVMAFKAHNQSFRSDSVSKG